ncbi:Recombination protein recR [Thermodesulfobium narugense DSM 14796]|uniref:Recombination protein RecR n=1 Tax=Thermodesulfobium narugense DSM 14796 TaxID=747365 RepID=M1E503_9BACT|nr:recombination mediator RecR [Thermodesulfobium narugense]AEE13896.1 Recombination protein recR [Thermodesulfobium narugense DSM 14796]
MKYPKPLSDLSHELSLLPGIGPKLALRLAFFISQRGEEKNLSLIEALQNLKNIKKCSQCNALSETDPCEICSDPSRNNEILCVVSDVRDLWKIESTKSYSGRYFVLNSLIVPLEGIDPEKAGMTELFSLIRAKKPKEIVIAFDFSMEGQTTSLYIKERLSSQRDQLGYIPQLTRLAVGLSMGDNLGNTDEFTISQAILHRQKI